MLDEKIKCRLDAMPAYMTGSFQYRAEIFFREFSNEEIAQMLIEIFGFDKVFATAISRFEREDIIVDALRFIWLLIPPYLYSDDHNAEAGKILELFVDPNLELPYALTTDTNIDKPTAVCNMMIQAAHDKRDSKPLRVVISEDNKLDD